MGAAVIETDDHPMTGGVVPRSALLGLCGQEHGIALPHEEARGDVLRRHDGQPKLRARRTMPEFQQGFRGNDLTTPYRNPSLSDGGSIDSSYKVVSLFAGCGGLDLGVLGGFRYGGSTYDALPFEVLHASDNLADAVQAYRLNIAEHAVLQDLTQVGAAELPSADVLMGGFPCQDFSSSGPKLGFAGKRGQLYRVLVEYMETHQPSVVIGENVPHLARLSDGIYLETILREFEETGYSFDVWELYGPDYGLSQSRRRLILMGVRNDIPGFPMMPRQTHLGRHVPIDEALADLEDVADESVPNQSQFFVSTRAKAGGGQGDHTNRKGTVAYCIRANARGRIQFHYELDRRLTVRECARLQSFPDEFVFPFSTQRNLTLIGNAVPPILGHAVGRVVADFLQNTRAGTLQSSIGHRRRSMGSYGAQGDLFASESVG